MMPPAIPPDALRIGSLYLPMLLAGAAARLTHARRLPLGAALLALLWTLPALVVLQRLNLRAGWWIFAPERANLCGMPLELLLGWAVLWGLVPELAFRRLPIFGSAALMVVFDLIAMPAMRPLVVLGPNWLMGEAAAAGLVLLPALSIARWTERGTHLRARAAIQVLTAGVLFLFLVPEIAFAMHPRSAAWAPLLYAPAWRFQATLAVLFLLALPGVAAVMEFAARGEGTPIPYDPPRRLVVSGVYRYCANPMQASCAAVLVAWAGTLRNPWLLIPAVISVVYSAGIARWDEAIDLQQRFGTEWVSYRYAVKLWRWRLRPYAAGPAARLYIASTCGPCSELRTWLEAHQPVGLEIIPAETLPQGSIRRMRYVHADETLEGVRALGRALEHIHLGCALAGAALRLPGIRQMVQLAADASGFGTRTLPAATPHG